MCGCLLAWVSSKGGLDASDLPTLVAEAARRAGKLWAAHRGLGLTFHPAVCHRLSSRQTHLALSHK
jgi:hypothetical protein